MAPKIYLLGIPNPKPTGPTLQYIIYNIINGYKAPRSIGFKELRPHKYIPNRQP